MLLVNMLTEDVLDDGPHWKLNRDGKVMIRKSILDSGISTKKESSENIWVISNQLHSNVNPKTLLKGVAPDRVIEYKISDLAKYMINPKPIEVTNRLIGCKIVSQKPATSKKENILKTLLNRLFTKSRGDADLHEETVISDYLNATPDITDVSFQSHVNRIKALLMPYDTLNERITGLDVAEIHDLFGVYDDSEGNHSLLQLNGTIAEKKDFILNHVHENISILLKKAYLNNGLFEMRGFDFSSYNPENASPLIIVTHNGESEAYVLGCNGNIDFEIEDLDLIRYLHFFQSSLRTNSNLIDLLRECKEGKIRPLKLFFNRELEIDYSKTDLPRIYKEVLDANTIPQNARDTVVAALNKKQIGILMSYICDTPQGKRCPSTCVYVMHDVRALETIKADLPNLYSQINQKLGSLATDNYYLMDSIKV
jgi:hypothetical protein